MEENQSDSKTLPFPDLFQKKRLLKPYAGILIFTLIFLAFAHMYQYAEILFYRPQGVHQWRQADCLSFADHYYQENRNFLEPAMYYQGYDGSGQTISEFPIIYFTIGQLWKWTGKQEFLFRLLQLSFFFSGLLALYKLSEILLKDSIWALLITFGLFTSTFLAYYANNFLADVPALSLVLIAWYWLVIFYKSKRTGFLYTGMFFLLFAGLLKISAALSFFVLIFLYLLRKGPFRLLSWDSANAWGIYSRKVIIGSAIILTTWAVWYSYARWYNHTHNYGIFLIGILPIWEMDTPGIQKVLYGLLKLWRQHFFRDEMLLILTGVMVWLGLRTQEIPSFARAFLIMTLLGVIGFLMLFFQVFDNHDYYALNLLILFPALTITALLTVQKTHNSIYKSWMIKCLMALIVIHCADFTRRRMISRYERLDDRHTGVYEKITPWLRSIGIQRTDKVISAGDNSPNATLYLMDQKGWSDFAWLTTQEDVKDKIEMGAKYLITRDTVASQRACFQPYIDRLAGTYMDSEFPNQQIQVWKLKTE